MFVNFLNDTHNTLGGKRNHDQIEFEARSLIVVSGFSGGTLGVCTQLSFSLLIERDTG